MEVDGGGWRRMEEAGGGTAGGALVPRRILLSGVARVPVPPTQDPSELARASRRGAHLFLPLRRRSLRRRRARSCSAALSPSPAASARLYGGGSAAPTALPTTAEASPILASEREHVLSPRRRYTGSGGHGDGPPAGMGRVRPEGAAVLRLLQGGGERVAAGELPHPEVHHLLLPRGLHPRVPLARRRLPRTASRFLVKPPPSFNFSSTRSASSFFPSRRPPCSWTSSPLISCVCCCCVVCAADTKHGARGARGGQGAAEAPGPRAHRVHVSPGTP